jgi:hypothetical protein
LLILGASRDQKNQQYEGDTQVFQLVHIGSLGGGRKYPKIPACSSTLHSRENEAYLVSDNGMQSYSARRDKMTRCF